MRSEKTDKPPIRETKAQIWREHSLQRATNPPEVCHFEPALASGPHRHDHNKHAPVAHLHRQHLPPFHDAAATDENQVNDVVEYQHRGEHVDNHLRSEEHTSELQSPDHLVCRLLLE